MKIFVRVNLNKLVLKQWTWSLVFFKKINFTYIRNNHGKFKKIKNKFDAFYHYF